MNRGIDSRPGGSVTDTKLVQLSKALLPIDVTLDGIIIDVNFLHCLKAPVPIEVTLDGSVIVKLIHFKNAYEPIVLTPFAIVTDVKLLQFWNA